jgi:hypothetical protein
LNNSWAATAAVRADGTLDDSPGGNYLNNTDSYAERGANLTGLGACRLGVWAQWDFASNDKAMVEIADGAGAPAYTQVLSGSSPYTYFEALVPEALNGRPDVRFRFRVVSDASGTADGIHVDYANVWCGRTPTYDGQSYLYGDGTSLSTPMVTGAAALLIAYRPGASVAQLKKALLDGTDPLPSLAGKTVTGGRLNARRSLDLIGTAIPNSYVRPKGATPTRMSMVPAFSACPPLSANKTHGAPLSYGSCSPPVQPSLLTIGSPDANGAGANSVGSVLLSTIVGNPSTPADEADVKLELSLTDVRNKSNLSDYTGLVYLNFTLRATDRNNGSGSDPATLIDLSLGPAFNCAATASASVGSTCGGTTTFDAIYPGIVKEGVRSVWDFKQATVYDAGPDGNPYTFGDNQPFARQGVFVP